MRAGAVGSYCWANLLFPMLLGMSLRRVVGVLRGMSGVALRCVCMVCRLLVTSRLVMTRRLAMMPGGMRMMF
jgi:hypothetical protein